MMQQDIANGVLRYQTHSQATSNLIEQRLQAVNQTWAGWQAAGDFLDYRYQDLSYSEQQQLREVRLTLALSQQRLGQQMRAIPERWLLPLWGFDVPASLEGLPETDQQELEQYR